MVVRGFLCGHALRQYTAGERALCGASMPDGMLPYQAFPQPIITLPPRRITGSMMRIYLQGNT